MLRALAIREMQIKASTISLHIYQNGWNDDDDDDNNNNKTPRVHQRIVYSSPKLETTPMCFNRWIVKQAVVRPHHEILLSSKKKRTVDENHDLNEPPENCAQWKKPVPKDYTVQESLCRTFLRWGTCWWWQVLGTRFVGEVIAAIKG